MSRAASILLAALALGPAAAQAQATRTWVSGVGDDVNPCSRTAPCKTFAGAISKTAAGGEISVLDPGGFGAVTITKSITIDGGGMHASVLSAGTYGIRVNNAATDVVVLRNISINGVGLGGVYPSPGLSGIVFQGGGRLLVQDCELSGFAGDGITATNGGTLVVDGTSIRSAAGSAIALDGGTMATVSRSQLATGGYGISAASTSRATVYDTVITDFSTAGISTSGSASVNVDHGVLAANVIGVQARVGTTVRLYGVMTSQNGTGVKGAGTVMSFGNNAVAAGNGTNGVPNGAAPQQ